MPSPPPVSTRLPTLVPAHGPRYHNRLREVARQVPNPRDPGEMMDEPLDQVAARLIRDSGRLAAFEAQAEADLREIRADRDRIGALQKATRDQLCATGQEVTDAKAANAKLAETAKRARIAHAAERAASVAHAHLAAGCVGVLVGVLVTVLVVAAL